MVDDPDFHFFRTEHRISATPEDIWHSFFNERNLERWLGDSRNGMSPRKNHRFIWRVSGLVVSGFVHEIDPYQRISFLWRIEEELSRWPEGHHALAHMRLSDLSGDNTFIELEISKFPFGEEGESRDLWNKIILPQLADFLKKNPDLEIASV